MSGHMCQRETGVEFRVNMTEDRDSWQAPYFLAVCCSAEGERLTRNARTWPNGKPRRWIEKRLVEPWTPAPVVARPAPQTDPTQRRTP